MATAVLLASGQLPEEFHPLLEQACSLWVDAPRQPETSIGILISTRNAIVESCRGVPDHNAKLLPKSTRMILYSTLWGALLENMESNEPIAPEFLRQSHDQTPTSIGGEHGRTIGCRFSSPHHRAAVG